MAWRSRILALSLFLASVGTGGVVHASGGKGLATLTVLAAPVMVATNGMSHLPGLGHPNL
jgi:hypothetical protein